MISGNTVSVATLIEEIQSELKDQTGSWRKVSELLNQADVEFGFGTDEMKQILGQTDISPSKASKLISIAQDDRIRQNSKVFETVSAWTTLYQATLLKDDEFSELVNNASEEGVLTVNDIRNVQDKKTKSSKSTYQSLLNVQFDWKAIKAQAVSSEDIQKVAGQYPEQLKSLSSTLLSAVAGIGGGVLQFIISLIIAVVFMAKSTSLHQGVSMLMRRLMNDNGERTINTTIATIRSVATGVLGVAVIQSLLSGVGLMLADIPGAGIWAIAVLILAIAQLPPILILGPIAAYYFSVADTTPAIAFLIFSILVSASDAFLKPLFLGRGMSIPMLVILLGAIGGMILSGIIGLFVGAVVLALGYELMMDWLSHTSNTDEGVENNETEAS